MHEYETEFDHSRSDVVAIEDAVTEFDTPWIRSIVILMRTTDGFMSDQVLRPNRHPADLGRWWHILQKC